MAETQDKDRMLQLDHRQYFIERAGTELWVTVYQTCDKDDASLRYFCALMPEADSSQALDDVSWDLTLRSGGPGIISHFEDGNTSDYYYKYGNDNGIEPLIIVRDFHGIRPSYVEVSEEFRLFHNLYHDAGNGKFISIDNNGDESDVILFQADIIKIKLSKIKEFLKIKQMILAVFVDSLRWSPYSAVELGITAKREDIRQNNLHLSLYVDDTTLGFDDHRKTSSKLMGKKFIFAPMKTSSDFKTKTSAEFIINVDQDGNPVSHDCEPRCLANYFGANPDAPHYLTPVFFRREVLNKYYTNTSKYTIDDGSVSCGALWSLTIDNNHEKFVSVFLGDLGRDLYYTEQLYWQSFNVPPEGKISEVNQRRSFDAEFADPTKPDLLFKYKFEEFQQQWIGKYGWPLFKPLSAEDAHYYKSLHVPLTNDHSEFDNQVLALAKIMVDSLNESKIQNLLAGNKIANEKGITKFERLFKEQGVAGFEPQICFLRDLYKLRHGAGHRKGEDYKKIAEMYRLYERGPMTVLEDIFRRAIALLEFIKISLI